MLVHDLPAVSELSDDHRHSRPPSDGRTFEGVVVDEDSLVFKVEGRDGHEPDDVDPQVLDLVFIVRNVGNLACSYMNASSEFCLV